MHTPFREHMKQIPFCSSAALGSVPPALPAPQGKQPTHNALGHCPLPSTCTFMAQRHFHRIPAAPPAAHPARLWVILCSPPNPPLSSTRTPSQPSAVQPPCSTPAKPHDLTTLGSSLQLVLSSTAMASAPPARQGRG